MGKPGCLNPNVHEHGISMADSRLLVPRALKSTPILINEKADFGLSRSRAVLFELHEIPFKDALRKLEDTPQYGEIGFAWCFLETIGTRMDGYFRYNEDAETFNDMFVRLTRRRGRDPLDQFNDTPFLERARFIGGNRRLTLGVYQEKFSGARISIVDSSEEEEAPVIIAKLLRRAGSAAKPQSAAEELISLNRG